MTTSTKVKFDGKVLIPQEPVDLPIGEILYIDFNDNKQLKKKKALDA